MCAISNEPRSASYLAGEGGPGEKERVFDGIWYYIGSVRSESQMDDGRAWAAHQDISSVPYGAFGFGSVLWHFDAPWPVPHLDSREEKDEETGPWRPYADTCGPGRWPVNLLPNATETSPYYSGRAFE